MNDKILFPYSSFTKVLLVKSQNHFFVDTITIRKLSIHFETLEVDQLLFKLKTFACVFRHTFLFSITTVSCHVCFFI